MILQCAFLLSLQPDRCALAVHRLGFGTVGTEKFHPLNHRLAKRFLDNSLHRLGDELQIAVVANMKSHFVLNVRELRPRIVKSIHPAIWSWRI
jgi:hypothetical protein